MRPSERHAPASEPEPSGDGLVWPMPVADADILWLETPVAATAPKPVATGASKPVATAASRAEIVAPAPGADNAVPVAATPKAASSAGITLAQLASANVAMEWHDAVAIVSQLADHVLAHRTRFPSGALPPLGAIQLEPDGQIHLRLEPNGSEPLAVGFGRVLQALLQDKPTPANLRLLAWRTTSDAGATLTLDEIMSELARWERPGRIGKLKDLYERARIAGPALPAANSAPAQVVPEFIQPAPVPSSEPADAAPPRWRRRIALLAACAILCVAAGGATVWLIESWAGSEEVVAPAATAVAPAADTQAAAEQPAPRPSVKRQARAASQRAQASAPRRESARTGQAQQSAPAAARTPPSAHEASADPAPSARPPATSPPKTTIASPPPQAAASLPPASAAPDRRIYKTGDAGVTDAILVKPYLPPRAHPDIPDTALGVIDVVVDARGLVETVHLRSPANRYREKWWLFTAKEWRFEPARKNGVPVRFMKQILLTDLNITEPQ